MMLDSSFSEVVPKNYNELHERYGKLIHIVLTKKNKVERNMEDLHSYIWMKILEAKLLERFEDYVRCQVPKVLTALEACELLGVSWGQWATAMWAYHKGVPRKRQGKRGRIPRKKGRWMPTPINVAEFQARGLAGYSAKTALFAFSDIIQLSLDERQFKNGSVRKPFLLIGRNIQNGTVIGRDRPEGYLKFPVVRVTKSMFRNYLIMAVLNHYANFCRTEDRRHKERPYIPPPFVEDEAQAWETNLPDKKADASTMIALSEARKILSTTIRKALSGVESCKPIEEHETEVFASLENGASLMRALRDTALPPKICQCVVDTMRPLAIGLRDLPG
jgi:hypothetical protein